MVDAKIDNLTDIPGGIHAIAINGFDGNAGCFNVKNSWSSDFADEG